MVSLWAILKWVSPKGPMVDLSRPMARREPPRPADRLRFAVATMVSPQETFVAYRRMVELIGRQVGREGTIVLRPTYRQVREALEKGTVDIAFVCTGTYVHSRDRGRIELLAQPEFKEGLSYRCLFIVPKRSPARSVGDLQGQTMAFTDPESNTGCLVPRAMLMKQGYDPQKFFAKIIFTGSHDRSVQAVAGGMVDVAGVDSLVFDSMVSKDPGLSDKVRVMWKSEAFGPPPMVVPRGLEPGLKSALRKALLSLHKMKECREALADIGIERFVVPREEDYESAYALYRVVQRKR